MSQIHGYYTRWTGPKFKAPDTSNRKLQQRLNSLIKGWNESGVLQPLLDKTGFTLSVLGRRYEYYSDDPDPFTRREKREKINYTINDLDLEEALANVFYMDCGSMMEPHTVSVKYKKKLVFECGIRRDEPHIVRCYHTGDWEHLLDQAYQNALAKTQQDKNRERQQERKERQEEELDLRRKFDLK